MPCLYLHLPPKKGGDSFLVMNPPFLLPAGKDFFRAADIVFNSQHCIFSDF